MSQGCGSTIVLLDLTFGKESNCDVVMNPSRLDSEIAEAIAEAGMKRRGGMLDAWEGPGYSKDFAPATSFHSLQESHVRVSTPDFVRLETWPDEFHANGEVQICNFSRDNSIPIQQLVRSLVERLRPTVAVLRFMARGPGPEPYLLGSFRLQLGEKYPFPLPLKSLDFSDAQAA